jgi:toxin secretion/phage lysis holin
MPKTSEWMTIGTALVASIGYALGGVDTLANTLFAVIVLDFVTGVLAAAYNKKLNSSVGFKGIIKKLSMFVAVAFANYLDMSGLFGQAGFLREMFMGLFIVTESLSIVENLGHSGVPLPAILREKLAQLRDTMDVRK